MSLSLSLCLPASLLRVVRWADVWESSGGAGSRATLSNCDLAFLTYILLGGLEMSQRYVMYDEQADPVLCCVCVAVMIASALLAVHSVI